MNLIVTDAADVPVGIAFSPQKVEGGGQGTDGAVSDVSFTITEADMPKMKNARNLRIRLDAYCDEALAGRHLRPDQQAKLALKLRKSGGITISTDEKKTPRLQIPDLIMKQFLLFAFLSCGFLTGTAQQLRTAYFMDKATLRTSMNPALRPARGFISIPAAGSISATYASNGVALGDLLYQKDGRLVTFMDPSVPAESFLRGLKTNNQLNADIAAEIVSAGWFSGRGFWTIGIGVKGTVSGNVPKSLFEFMKYGSGPDGTTYDIEKLHVYTDSYVDVSIGYSRPLNDRWTIGGKYKFLVGAGNADIHFTNLHAVMNGDSWRITSQGRMSASVQGLRPTLAADRHGREYIDGFDFRSPGVAGYGSAIDLGATYKILDNLTVSGAGAIRLSDSFGGASTRQSNGAAQGEFDFAGFDLPIGNDRPDNPIGDQMDDLTDNLQELFHFSETPSQSRTTMLRSTINLGAEYAGRQKQGQPRACSPAPASDKPKASAGLDRLGQLPPDRLVRCDGQLLVHSQRLRNVRLRAEFQPLMGSIFFHRKRLYVHQGESAVHPDQGLRSQPVFRTRRSARERTVVQAIAGLLRIKFGQVLVLEK